MRIETIVERGNERKSAGKIAIRFRTEPSTKGVTGTIEEG